MTTARICYLVWDLWEKKLKKKPLRFENGRGFFYGRQRLMVSVSKRCRFVHRYFNRLCCHIYQSGNSVALSTDESLFQSASCHQSR